MNEHYIYLCSVKVMQSFGPGFNPLWSLFVAVEIVLVSIDSFTFDVTVWDHLLHRSCCVPTFFLVCIHRSLTLLEHKVLILNKRKWNGNAQRRHSTYVPKLMKNFNLEEHIRGQLLPKSTMLFGFLNIKKCIFLLQLWRLSKLVL